MLISKEVTKELEDFGKIYNLYHKSFPRPERIFMSFLLKRSKGGQADFIAYYDDACFVGIAYLIHHGDLTMVLYLATSSEVHSKGYGSKILSTIKSKYNNQRIILSIEKIDELAKNNEQRIRRREFYFKNEFISSGVFLMERHVIYEILIYNGAFTYQEYYNMMERFSGKFLFPFAKPKEIIG